MTTPAPHYSYPSRDGYFARMIAAQKEVKDE